jgi:uncharacterized protein YegP (UPF0339 family)
MAIPLKPGILGTNSYSLGILDIPEPDYAAPMGILPPIVPATPVAPPPRPAMRFETYKDRRGEWRWTLRAANGEPLADSAEGYRCRADMMRIINRLRGGASIGVQERKSS